MELDLELLAQGSSEGINHSCIALIVHHCSHHIIRSSFRFAFLVAYMWSPKRVVFLDLQIWEIPSGLSWESIIEPKSTILASSELPLCLDLTFYLSGSCSPNSCSRDSAFYLLAEQQLHSPSWENIAGSFYAILVAWVSHILSTVVLSFSPPK